MTFRKNSLQLYEWEVAHIVLGLMTMVGCFLVGWTMMLFFIPSIVQIFVGPLLFNEFITIDEHGIICKRSGNIIWSYKWNDIAELKRSYRYRRLAIEIILIDSKDETETPQFLGHYFLLNSTAKKAIEQYHKREV